jgi:hypothetical protein
MPNPNGPPQPGGGLVWTRVFYDDFDDPDHTGVPDPTRWVSLNGYGINGTGCLGAAANSTVANGYLYMTVASASSGAYLSSSPSDGAGVNGWELPVGGCVEARIYMPGPSSTNPYNWGGYFASGQDWPLNGEIDVCEGNGEGIDINYHYEDDGEQQSGPYNPSGNWCNSWHTYTAVRGASTVSFYWDGVLVHPPWATDDEGGPMSILPCNGTGGGGPAAYGIGNAILVDYVYGWIPGAGGGGGGGGGTGTISYRAASQTTESSGDVTSYTVSKQSGTAAGDWIFIYVFGADGGTPACAGFEVLPVDDENIGTLLYRQATGTEPSTFNITGLGGSVVTATIATIAGASSTITLGTPADAGGAYESFSNGGVSMPAAGWALWFAGNENLFGGPGFAITPPAGYTSRSTNGAQSANATMMLADNQSAPEGATGAQTGTSTGAAYWSGVMVGLTPGPAPTVTPGGLVIASFI